MAKKKKEEEAKFRIRLKIKGYDHRIVERSCRQIIDLAYSFGAKIKGPVPLPTEIHKFTVLRSSFVKKDSREQFEMRVHKRLIEIENPPRRLIDSLQNLTLPAGVDVEIKVL